MLIDSSNIFDKNNKTKKIIIVQPKTLNPTWNETLTLELTSPITTETPDTFLFQVYDYDRVGAADFMVFFLHFFFTLIPKLRKKGRV